MADKDVETWTIHDVSSWLDKIDLHEDSKQMALKHRVDGKSLLMLSEEDLRQPPVQLQYLGDIKRISKNIQELKLSIRSQRLATQNSRENSPSLQIGNSDPYNNPFHNRTVAPHNALHASASQLSQRQDSVESDEVDYWRGRTQGGQHQQRPRLIPSSDIPPELWKTILSFVYVFTVFMLTAFVMVVVHDRVPEMDKYPPLPDLFLDNMPHVPWAFDACELVGLTLGTMWFVLLFFHKHRFVLMRRFFSLMGTIFLLRCVTMLITSLSVPGRHLQCSGQRYGDWYTRLERTFEIWKGMGMSLQGVRSCGDYMFSGHTSVMTMLTFFITEYTPRKYYYVHTASWCLYLFGIFFLLAAHEHYSIDVFVALYLSSRLFMYYHTLANNRALQAADAQRTRVWFPLFAFFESRCEGRVPNEFEFPLRNLGSNLKMLLCQVPSYFSSLRQRNVSESAEKSVRLSTSSSEMNGKEKVR